jgi:eukaryotic-like serine/threonine-protein kinase
LTANGLPYFVMEYVDGVRLDDYCRQNRLSISQRLELFRKICAAVSYAHQHLIIHRDIKPANIRVTGNGEPKLLDFGIAKLIDPATSTIGEPTQTFQAVMTPEYASPEQARGETMTTASDVYSLGVVLYELLTGQKPYRLDKRSPAAVVRVITEQQPTRPSTVVASASSRWFVGWKPMPPLRGDLDNIVLKALRKEPERRYSSVAQFSEDIRRHLDGLPVIARKDTIGYRSAKFINRHRIGVAAAALVVLSLVAGIIATAWEAHNANQERALAERRFDQVRRLADSLMFEIHDSVKDLPGSTPTRRLIVSRALEYLDGLAHDAGNNAALQRDLATAYERVGDIQGNPYYANLGDTDGALVSYRKAMAIRKALRSVDSTVETELALARSYRGLGDIFEQKGEITQSVGSYRKSLSILQQLATRYPASSSVQDEFARAYEVLGDGLNRAANSIKERSDCYQKSLSIRQSLLAQKPSDPKLQRSVAITLLKIGGSSNPKEAQAIDSVKRGVAMLETLSAKNPDNERARRDVGHAYYQLGEMQDAAGDLTGGLETRRKAFAVRRQIAAQDPKNVQARFDLATAHGDLAESLTAVGNTREALDHAEQSLSIFQELCAADPGNAVYRRNLGLCYEKIGRVRARAAEDEKRPAAQRISDWQKARDWYRKGGGIFSSMHAQGTLMPADSAEPQQFAAEIQKCDEAIAQLKK